jgi:hypothetical protein
VTADGSANCRIVCLANSRKLAGRCVAGKDADTGAWLRPLGESPTKELSARERRLIDNSEPRLLDIIEVPIRGHRPRNYQAENVAVDRTRPWVRKGRISPNDLPRYIDSPKTLWLNGESSYKGINDRVAGANAAKLTNSLYLVEVDSLGLRVHAPGADFGNEARRVSAEFSYRGVTYRLRVTDASIEQEYLAKPDGRYQLRRAYLTVSLGEPYEGFAYKLVAGIIPAEVNDGQ